MPTIPPWVPPVTTAGELNTQRLASESVKTIAGDATVIPIAYGTVQAPGKIFAVDYDDTTDPNLPVWTIGVFWCWGECEAINATFLNGVAPVAGVTQNDYLGTTSQTADALLTAAISGYSDTLVVNDDRGNVGICYSVFQYTEDDYSTWPDFVAEISGRKVFDPRDGTQVFATPSTWKFSATPALVLRDFMTATMFGPGESVDDTSVIAVADDNDATVTTEARRVIGLLIDTRQRWDTWRKVLETYAGCWTYKRDTDWILKSDRPRTPDFKLTDTDFVEGSFKVSITPLSTIPTLVRVWYTDKTEPIWRERFAEAELAGVGSGSLERRTNEVKLPGITRYTQALREANERLAKLNRYLQIQGTLLDNHIGIEAGDVVTVTHKLGLAAVDFRILPFPAQGEPGRMTIRGQRYSSSDYSDLETTKTFLTPTRFSGSLGTTPTHRLLGKKNNSDFTTSNEGDVYVHGVSESGVAVDQDGLISSDGLMVSIPKGIVRTSLSGVVGYAAWDADEADPFTIRNDANTANISVSLALVFKDSAGNWTYDDNNGNATGFDITAAAFDQVRAIGTIELNSTPAVESITMFGEAVPLSSIPSPTATNGGQVGQNINGEDGSTAPAGVVLNNEIKRMDVFDDTLALSFRDGLSTWWNNNKSNDFTGVSVLWNATDGFHLKFDCSAMPTAPFFMWSKYPTIMERDAFGEYTMLVEGWFDNNGAAFDLVCDFGAYINCFDENKISLDSGVTAYEYSNDLNEMNNVTFAGLSQGMTEAGTLSPYAADIAQTLYVSWGFAITNYKDDDPSFGFFYLRPWKSNRITFQKDN